MCLSAVYEIRNGCESLICDHATAIDIDGNIIRLTDIIGDEIIVSGALRSVDLVRNIVKIEAKEPSNALCK